MIVSRVTDYMRFCVIRMININYVSISSGDCRYRHVGCPVFVEPCWIRAGGLRNNHRCNEKGIQHGHVLFRIRNGELHYLVNSRTSEITGFTSAKHLRTLKIPGREISAMSWEGNSLRCAMTVDSFIYFANIRPDYMWCYFNKTVVFVNGSGGDQPGTITFWDTTSNQV